MNPLYFRKFQENTILTSVIGTAVPILMIAVMVKFLPINIALLGAGTLLIVISVSSVLLRKKLDRMLKEIIRERNDYVHQIRNGHGDEVYMDLHVHPQTEGIMFLIGMCVMFAIMGAIAAMSVATIYIALNFL